MPAASGKSPEAVVHSAAAGRARLAPDTVALYAKSLFAVREEVRGLRLYDVLVIVDPRLTEEEVAQLLGRLQESCTGLGGEIVATENWGRRRLSFELRKQREGSYLLLTIKAEPAAVREYERQLRLNESVLRFMTTRVIERRAPAPPERPAEPGPAAEPAVEPTAGGVG
jgi:small subunit ribosomal protein S6